MKNFLRTSLCCLLLALAATLRAQTPSGLSVTFNRTGANGASVAVSVGDLAGHAVSGATGTLALSHDMKTSGTNITSGILCPNANGNASPTIVFTLSLSGLPADFAFDGIGLDIHALNGIGAYQYNNDSKARKFNVREQIDTDGTPADFATLSDIDIAAGVGSEGNVHQVWTASGTMATAAAGTLTLTLTVTAGTSNVGCFFGLSEIRFTNSEAPEPTPDPEPEPDPNGRIVNLKWKNTTELYITEEADGSLVVAEYDTSRRMFWQLVPTDAENVFYVRNTATGRYIQSCNLTPSSDSKLKTVDTPVPYYMGRTAATAAEITGCYYFSSTDCTNYSNEATSPRALNKDGASSSIITWQAGPNNGTYRVGSYWKAIDTEDLYEARPFTPVSEKGNGTYLYNMVSTATGKGLQMNGEGTPEWQPLNESDGQTWYFVGESNRAGGYEIVCRSGDRTLTVGEHAKWCIYPAATEEDAYFFRPYGADIAQTCALTVEGDSLFRFRQVRSAFARSAGIYRLPCGQLSGTYVAQAAVQGPAALTPLHYPIATLSGSSAATGSVQPSSWYTLFTHSQATLARGRELQATFGLNAAPAEGTQCFAYFDWNGDGVFETAHELTIGQQMQLSTTVPQDARVGKSRLRLRLTNNGLTDAEDDVNGQTIDFILHITDSDATEFTATVSSADPTRGMATLTAPTTALATPIGNAAFLAWREGRAVVSTDAEYTFTLDHNVNLVALFTPNTSEIGTGIDAIGQNVERTIVQIKAGQGVVRAVGDASVRSFRLYSADGALVGQTAGREISVKHLPQGTYIAYIITDGGTDAAKVCVK